MLQHEKKALEGSSFSCRLSLSLSPLSLSPSILKWPYSLAAEAHLQTLNIRKQEIQFVTGFLATPP